jgi:polyisoprenoid-binding protein YceI
MLRLIPALLALAGGTMEYDLGPLEGNHFSLTVEKTGLLRGKKHLFEFERYHGRLVYDPQAPERSAVQFVVEGRSAVLKDDWVSDKDRKKILRVAFEEMMEVDKHPELRFSSTRILRNGSAFDVEGMLEIRGVARPVTVGAKLEEGVLTGRAAVRMKEYGLKPPTALLGTIGTKDEMTVEFRLGVKQ